jgi:Cdc6-like AAA superfamily ATPase
VSEITPHNAFTPAKEVRDIDRFAGRGRELTALSNALQSDGAQLVLYGQRGIGKSSLSRVLVQLASSDKEVLERLPTKPFSDFDYVPIYFACDDSVSSVDKLLVRLLTDEAGLAPWVPFKVVERKTGDEGGGKFSIKILELSGKLSESITERATEVDADIVATFTNACRAVVKSGVAKNGLLIVIDEFDRIKDRSGIASLLKTLGPEGVTFALVGVATTIQDLIAEHESVSRQLADGAVHVEPMTDSELHEIISRAMAALDNKYSFENSAANWIVSIARGHPFYVHLVGKHALLRAIAAGSTCVSEQTARDALAEIALKGSAPIQETLYKTAIGHSYLREFVLKQFANQTQDEIHTTELYAGIARELRIDAGAVSVYVGHLASEKYGAVLAKTRDRYYRFGDSLFKAYAAARPYERRPGDKEDDA